MGRYGLSSIGCFVVVVMILLEFTTAAEYTVGDSMGWTIPNSTDYYNDVWAKNKTFLIGDQLVFKWNGTHNVARVLKEQYENCGKNGGSVRVSPLTLNLTENGTRYFICTVGDHCTRGQKLEITVGNGIAPPSAAAPPSLSTAPLPPLFILSIVLAISLLNFHGPCLIRSLILSQFPFI